MTLEKKTYTAEDIGKVVGGSIATIGSVYAVYIFLNKPNLEELLCSRLTWEMPWIYGLVLVGAVGAAAGGLVGKLFDYYANK